MDGMHTDWYVTKVGNLLRLKARSGAGGAAVPWIFAWIQRVRKRIHLQHAAGCRCQGH